MLSCLAFKGVKLEHFKMATWFQSMRTNVRVDFHLKMAVHSWLGLAIPGSVSCLFSVITHTSRVCAVCVCMCVRGSVSCLN